jgi:hypothetical protein
VVDALDVLQECIEMEQPLVNDHIEVCSLVIIISRSLQFIWSFMKLNYLYTFSLLT